MAMDCRVNRFETKGLQRRRPPPGGKGGETRRGAAMDKAGLLWSLFRG